MMVHQLIDAVYRKFHVEISSDQVKYILKCNHIRNKERSRSSCRAGGAGDAVEFLFHNTEREAYSAVVAAPLLLRRFCCAIFAASLLLRRHCGAVVTVLFFAAPLCIQV